MSGHADARIDFSRGRREGLQENVAESNGADALRVVREEGLFHTLFVKWIAALLGNANFVERDAHRLGLQSKKIAPDTVHADAVETFSDSGEERDDLHLRIELQSVQGHGGVFAAGPARGWAQTLAGLRKDILSVAIDTQKRGGEEEKQQRKGLKLSRLAETLVAKELPTLRERREGWGTELVWIARLARVHILVASGELVFEADADVAAQGGDADYFLIAAVEKVGGAHVEREATRKCVAGGEIKASIAGIACEAEAEKVAVGARPAEVAGNSECEGGGRRRST